MKKVFSLLLMLVLLFPMIPSLAESAYPACQGTVTDLADVLPDDAEKDFEKLSGSDVRIDTIPMNVACHDSVIDDLR